MKLSTNFKHNVRLIFIITDVVMIMLNHKLKTVSNSGVVWLWGSSQLTKFLFNLSLDIKFKKNIMN